MVDKRFNFFDFLVRWVLGIVLVFATYNPSGYSWFHWFRDAPEKIDPVLMLAAVILVIGWVIYLRATSRSLGLLGVVLATAFFGVLIWLLVDFGLLAFDTSATTQYIVLLGLATIMAIGISWSHIRRKMTGQLDVDDVDEG